MKPRKRADAPLVGDVGEVLESAMARWEGGDKRGAATLLRRAADLAAQQGDEPRAATLRRLAGDLHRALNLNGTGPGEGADRALDSEPDTLPSRQPPGRVCVRRPPFPDSMQGEEPSPIQYDAPVRLNPGSTMPAQADGASPACGSSCPVIPAPAPIAALSDGSGEWAPGEHPPFPARARRHRRRRATRRKRRERTRVILHPRGLRHRHAAPAPSSGAATTVDGRAPLAKLPAFADLGHCARATLRRHARRIELETGTSVPAAGLVLVIRGALCAHGPQQGPCDVVAPPGSLVATEPRSLHAAQWRACRQPTCVALCGEATTWKVLELASGLEESLRLAAQRTDALVSALQGPLGRLECDPVRRALIARCDALALQPCEPLVEPGDRLPGLVIAGAGLLLRVRDGETSAFAPGTPVNAAALLEGLPSPERLRASGTGATLLVISRSAAHELACEWPLLVEWLTTPRW